MLRETTWWNHLKKNKKRQIYLTRFNYYLQGHILSEEALNVLQTDLF